MKLVKFENGTYGVTIGFWFFREFLDMWSVFDPIEPTWWSKPHNVNRYCHGTEERALERMKSIRLVRAARVKFAIVK
jgi:hypothetical protein